MEMVVMHHIAIRPLYAITQDDEEHLWLATQEGSFCRHAIETSKEVLKFSLLTAISNFHLLGLAYHLHPRTSKCTSTSVSMWSNK